METQLNEVKKTFEDKKRLTCEQLLNLYGIEVSKDLAKLVDQDLIVVDAKDNSWILK